MTGDDNALARQQADARELEATLRELSATAEQVGESLSAGLRRAALAGRDLDDALRQVALRLSNMALERALQPLDQLAGALLSGSAPGASQAGPTTGRSQPQALAGAAAALGRASFGRS